MSNTSASTSRMRRFGGRILLVGFYLIIVAFLVIALTHVDWEIVGETRLDWRWLALGTAVGLANLGWIVFIWLRLLRSLGAHGMQPLLPEMAHAYAKSWLGRYTPGPAAWVVGKIYFAGRLGVSRSKLAVSSFLEAGLQTLVTLIIGLVLVLLDTGASDALDPRLRLVMIAGLVLGIFALSPSVFNTVAVWAYRLIRRRGLDRSHLPTWSTIGQGLWMYGLSAGLVGLSSFLVIKALWPSLHWSTVGYVTGITSLTSALGVLAIAVPAGLGVREVMLAPMLTLVMPTDIAIVAVVVLRLWSIVLDILFFLITSTWVTIDRRMKRRSE